MELISEFKSFGGWQKRYSHPSKSCHCTMTFSIYLPPQAEKEKVPVLYWLSGLTCTDENFVQKAGAQAYASQYGVAIVAPDTSPRGDGVTDDADGAYDFGLGASFYVNAEQAPFDKYYHMFDYVVKELPALINQNFSVDSNRVGIFGHSMGGHGALTIGLKNPEIYQSISAFAPIVAPSQVPWGEKAFSGYLGKDQKKWQAHDACALIAQITQGICKTPLLVDQGKADNYLDDQLKPHLLEEACTKAQHPLTLRYQEDYDHSYFFIASFMKDHIAHHAKMLSNTG